MIRSTSRRRGRARKYGPRPMTLADADPYLDEGARVLVRGYTSKPGKGLSYAPFEGVLVEGTRIGGWDVVDVRANDGQEVSVYAFSLQASK